MEKLGYDYKHCHMSGTIIHMALDNEYAGHIVISDEIKEESKESIKELKKCGVKKTIMLTGDTESVAKDVAGQIGVDEYHAELLPADKVEQVEKIIKEVNRKIDTTEN